MRRPVFRSKVSGAGNSNQTSSAALAPEKPPPRGPSPTARALRQEEQRRAEEERARQRENEAVFRAWLQRKRGQVAETRRVQRAKQIEDLGGRVSEAPGGRGTGGRGRDPAVQRV